MVVVTSDGIKFTIHLFNNLNTEKIKVSQIKPLFEF